MFRGFGVLYRTHAVQPLGLRLHFGAADGQLPRQAVTAVGRVLAISACYPEARSPGFRGRAQPGYAAYPAAGPTTAFHNAFPVLVSSPSLARSLP